eukprot:2111806-Amphidinium_carterae.1
MVRAPRWRKLWADTGQRVQASALPHDCYYSALGGGGCNGEDQNWSVVGSHAENAGNIVTKSAGGLLRQLAVKL